MIPLSQRDARLEVSTTHMVFMSMFRTLKKFEVFYMIVRPVAIYVMNCFVTAKFTTKTLFYYITMLKKPLTINTDKNISILSFSSRLFPSRVLFAIISLYFRLINGIVFMTTRIGTILSNCKSVLGDVKRFIAKFTVDEFTVLDHKYTSYCTE